MWNIANRTEVVELISDHFPNNVSVSRDQTCEEIVMRPVFKCYEWLLPQGKETETDEDDADNQCQSLLHRKRSTLKCCNIT